MEKYDDCPNSCDETDWSYDGQVCLACGWPQTPLDTLVDQIKAELARARAKFPGDNVTTLALVEEVGELAKATFEESGARVREEAVQVAVMAMRVVLDGDATLEAWRAARGLDRLGGPIKRPEV